MKSCVFFSFFLCVCLLGCTTQESRDEVARNQRAAIYNMTLGVTYLDQGDVERAKTKLSRALNQAPNSPDTNDAMAYFLERTGESAQAETYYLKAIQLASTRGETHNNYGTFLCRAKRYEEAEKHFLMAVADPNYIKVAEVYENAGMCAMQSGNMKKGEGYFKQAIEKNPMRAVSWWQLAMLTYTRKDYAAAREYLNHYLQLGPATEQSRWLSAQLNGIKA